MRCIRRCWAPHSFIGSMSRKGNCSDNAVTERFFLSLKMEWVWLRDYANHAEAQADIADYTVGIYNSVRLHSKLGNLPPKAFEQQSATTQPIFVSEKTRPARCSLNQPKELRSCERTTIVHSFHFSKSISGRKLS